MKTIATTLFFVLAFIAPDTGGNPANSHRFRRNPGASNQVALYKDLVSHWKLYDSEGELIQLEDDGPAKSTMVKSGNPTFAFSGQVSSYSMALNGTTDFLLLNDASNAYNQGGSFTIRARVKFNLLSRAEAIWHYGTTSRFALNKQANDTITWSVTGSNSKTVVGNQTVVAGTWYCLIVWFDAHAKKIGIAMYPGQMFNFGTPPLAVHVETDTGWNSTLAGASVMRFGTIANGAPALFLNGNISHFMFYKRTLKPMEERLIACTDYASFPYLVWQGISAPPAPIPAAPSSPLVSP